MHIKNVKCCIFDEYENVYCQMQQQLWKAFEMLTDEIKWFFGFEGIKCINIQCTQ